ncbi:MAG TPA: hypothetical protein DCL54_04675 [Alphaproteobacteria bacterium]|nr:hypothetical protein [Alphaproteobacteria bacterium]HAJ45859.1 hypothetical protein [Alphaproteobacteria bacterium]
MTSGEAFFVPGAVYEVLIPRAEWPWLRPGMRLIYAEFFSNHYDGFQAQVFQYAPVDETDAARFVEPEDICQIDWRWMGEAEPDWPSFLRRVEARAYERLRKRALRPRAKPLPLP